MEQTYGDKRIAALSLRELTREGGEDFLLRRTIIEVDHTNWTPEQKEEVKQLADDVVQTFHAGDVRDDKTYATHVLRVACRLLSKNHFNVRDDPELILAALLHDVVEDHPERLLGLSEVPKTLEEEQEMRDQALQVITERYSERVAAMVLGATNPLYDKTGISEEARQDIYRKHVRELMRSDSDARLIKLSDFIDNCLGLEYNPDPVRRFKLARKYQPLITDMRIYVRNSSLSIPVQNDIQNDLLHAEVLCETIIREQGSTISSLGNLATSQSQQGRAKGA
jgi:(p)ppGpp synthase/HD superfamily hydrolase